MKLVLNNFGGFKGLQTVNLESKTLPNGAGKTTTVNAYVWLLTGRTISSFDPSNKFTDGTPTSVTLIDFLGMPEIRRVLTPAGTTLYLDGEFMTQEEFTSALSLLGYDLQFIAACAQGNILASNDLTTEDLRKLLARADVLNDESYKELKKKLANVRKEIKVSEQYALSMVTVPKRTVEDLTVAEKEFVTKFTKAKQITVEGVTHSCPTCERSYGKESIDKLTVEFDEATITVEEGLTEYARIVVKGSNYKSETVAINDAERLVRAATKAREDVVTLNEEADEILLELKAADEATITQSLPPDVEIITEVPMKNGRMKSTCTLTFNGIPLKNINHAKRVDICVDILNTARYTKDMLDIPIIVDNAEAITSKFEHIQNIILLNAGE